MVRPNPRYGDPSDPDVIKGLQTLQIAQANAEKLADRVWGNNPYGNRGGASNPSLVPLPSWWHGLPFEVYENKYTKEQAVEYLQVSEKIIESRRAVLRYQCDVMGNTGACQNLGLEGSGVLSRIRENIQFLQAQIIGLKEGSTAQDWTVKEPETFQLLPQVFAQEDPSVNSGLNGNEQESQVINYPQSANVRIVISNISMFSTSIPINDIGQLQILSNESNEWRYSLIGSSTNQPLMTLSGLITKINSMIASAVITPQSQPPQLPPIEEPHITTVHIPPPEIPVEEPQMVTVTPTEPGQVNWIPEPFFSFINNVFRR